MMVPVTVLMSVRNGERFLRDAVQSILGQCFRNFEFLVINDGSTDATKSILDSFRDPRIRMLHSDRNQGLAASLNWGIRESKGRYLVRMDADDMALPNRLRRQVDFMEAHPEIAVAGCACYKVDENGEITGLTPFFETDEQIKRQMTLEPREAPIAHPAAIIRKEAITKVGFYDESLPLTQDKDLWIRIANQNFRFANLPEPLLKRRKSLEVNESPEYLKRHDQVRLQVYRKHQQTLWRLYEEHQGLPVPLLGFDSADSLCREGYAELYTQLGQGFSKMHDFVKARQAFLLSLKLKEKKKKAYQGWIQTQREQRRRHHAYYGHISQSPRAQHAFFKQVKRMTPKRIAAGKPLDFPLEVALFRGWLKDRLAGTRYPAVSLPETRRIVYVTNEFVTEHRYCSGLAHYLQRMAKELTQRGHDIHVLTLSGKSRRTSRFEGFWVHRMKPLSRPLWVDKILLKCRLYTPMHRIDFLVQVILSLWKLKQQFRIDLIQYTNAYASSLLAGPMLGIPYTVRISSHRPSWHAQSGKKRNLDMKIQEWSEWLQIRTSRYAYAPSRRIQKVFSEQSGIKHIQVIPTPVYIEETQWDTSFLNDHLAGKKYFLFFGNFKPAKGIHVLSEILNRFLVRHPDASAVLIGKDQETEFGPSMAEYVRSQCREGSDRLHIYPPLPHAQLYPVIQRAHVVVLPSVVDNLPNTCLESMALGKAVIGTCGTSFEELMMDRENGYLVPPGDAQALLQKMEEVWDSAHLDQIGERARIRAGYFSPDRLIPVILRYYDGVIRNLRINPDDIQEPQVPEIGMKTVKETPVSMEQVTS